MIPYELKLSRVVSQYLEENGYLTFSPKAFFFDMDGVLFDSMSHHAPAWVQAFKDHGFEFSINDAYRCEGRVGRLTVDEYYREHMDRPATEDEKDAIYGAKSKHFRAYGENTIIPNVDKVLAFLKNEGKQLFVVTGSAEKTLLNSLEKSFPNTFSPERMVTAYDVTYGKPNPEPYLKALEKSGVNPWEAVVIENAPLGAISGRSANIFTIAINTGILSDEELYESGAHIVLPDMAALHAILGSICKPISITTPKDQVGTK